MEERQALNLCLSRGSSPWGAAIPNPAHRAGFGRFGGLMRQYYDVAHYGNFMIAYNALPPYPEWSEDWPVVESAPVPSMLRPLWVSCRPRMPRVSMI